MLMVTIVGQSSTDRSVFNLPISSTFLLLRIPIWTLY